MPLLAPIRPWHGSLEPLWWAVTALRRELWGFRFDYPIETVPAAGSTASLHYYVYSDRLFFDAMEPGPDGTPVQRSRTLHIYNPAYVAWYGLMSLERWLRYEDSEALSAFHRQVAWLEAHAVRRDADATVWPVTVDWQEGASRLNAPWISAMVQGLVISTLVRAHRITGEPRLLEYCHRAIAVFDRTIEEGGVRTVDAGRVTYEEYPAFPLSRVLDGYLFGLLGLYDLFAQTQDPRAGRLFAEGLEGLKNALPFWDYNGKWSWYGAHGYLCPPHYNKLNSALLTALGRLSGERTLTRYAEAWTPTRLNALERAEVFLVFLFTKNRTRLTHLLRGAA